MTGLRPTRSERAGHRKRPASMPAGYAEVSHPKEAPTSSPKCEPSAGVIGPAIVKPSRLRKAASRMLKTERFLREKSSDQRGRRRAGAAPSESPVAAAISIGGLARAADDCDDEDGAEAADEVGVDGARWWPPSVAGAAGGSGARSRRRVKRGAGAGRSADEGQSSAATTAATIRRRPTAWARIAKRGRLDVWRLWVG